MDDGKGGVKHRQQQQQQQQQQQNENSKRRNRKKRPRPRSTQNEKEPSPSSSLSSLLQVSIEGVKEGDGLSSWSVPPALPSNVFQEEPHHPFSKAWSSLGKKKKKKHHGTSQDVWTPTPIQCQAWPILLQAPPPEQPRDNSTTTAATIRTKPVACISCLLGIAPTGSGKTLAYGLPLLYWAAACPMSVGLVGLVLVPTRELALQAEKDLRRSSCRTAVRVMAIYGGVDKSTQQQALFTTTNTLPLVVVATPGRLGDLLRQQQQQQQQQTATKTTHIGGCVFGGLEMLVLDEADRLATHTDMSNQVDEVLSLLQQQQTTNNQMTKRTALFSATFPQQSASKWKAWMNHQPYAMIRVNTVTIGTATRQEEQVQGRENENDKRQSGHKEPKERKGEQEGDDDDDNNNNDEATTDDVENRSNRNKKQRREPSGPMDLARIPDRVSQILNVCASHKKPRKLVTTLQKIYQQRQGRRRRHKPLCLVFFGRIKTLRYVLRMLQKDPLPVIGTSVAEWHSHLPQTQREKVLMNFRCGKTPLLLATDVAARGLHVSNLEFVINYDFPTSLEQYVHRCGRVGRGQQQQQQQQQQHDQTSSPGSSNQAVVYSFFTRDFKPMAPNVLSLLRQTNAYVDPNLLALVDGGGGKNGPKRGKKKSNKEESLPKKLKKPSGEDNGVEEGEQDNDWDDGQFASLDPNRILLQRASHVSDASSVSSSEEE